MKTDWREPVADATAAGAIDAIAWTRTPWPPPPPPGAPASANRRHWLEHLFLLGLAGVFLTNAAVAWMQPTSFVTLAQQSRVGAWLDLGGAPWLVPLIGVNDLLIGLAVLVGIWSRRVPTRLVLAWAGVWLLAVAVLKLTALDLANGL